MNAHLRVLTEIHNKPWAILPEALHSIIDIAERDSRIEGVAARTGEPLLNNGNGVILRDGVGILNVEGPIFRYANLFTAISGATSIELLAQDFDQLLADNSVDSILLNINSPGGQVDGVQEFADMVRAGSAIKPVTAYVDGMAASAAYWIAAAAPRIAASEASMLGSVGVVASVTDNRDAQRRQGVTRYEIVSSQSPFKRPDPATEQGRSQLQDMVDALADIFISRLALFRNTTADNVAQNFGQGKILIAKQAIGAGMADEVTNFEPLVARLAADRSPRAFISATTTKELPMAEATQAVAPPNPTQTPTPVAAPATPSSPQATPTEQPRPAVNERERMRAILSAPEAQGREQMARTLALETDLDAAAAIKVLASSPKQGPANPLAAEMAFVANPKVGAGGGDGDDSPQSEAARILAFVPQARRVKAAN